MKKILAFLLGLTLLGCAGLQTQPTALEKANFQLGTVLFLEKNPSWAKGIVLSAEGLKAMIVSGEVKTIDQAIAWAKQAALAGVEDPVKAVLIGNYVDAMGEYARGSLLSVPAPEVPKRLETYAGWIAEAARLTLPREAVRR